MTLTLGQLREELLGYNAEHTVRFDLPLWVQPTTLASWRGIYAELALGYEVIAYHTARTMTVRALLDLIEAANGAVHEGWKGGDFRMSWSTPVHVDNRGCYTQTRITGTRFDGQDVLIKVEGEDE